jgi:hypothetical protein
VPTNTEIVEKGIKGVSEIMVEKTTIKKFIEKFKKRVQIYRSQ